MKRNVFRAAVFLLAASGGWQAAQARLGETALQMQQRYGASIASKQIDIFTRCDYAKLGSLVQVYFLGGRSVMEVFARRGLSGTEAAELTAKVAGFTPPPLAPKVEKQVRDASGINSREEFFWSWVAQTPPGTVVAAFNPVECTVVFFGNPAIYARVHRAQTALP